MLRLPLPISDRHDGVIERRMNVSKSVRYLALAFFRATGPELSAGAILCLAFPSALPGSIVICRFLMLSFFVVF